jgi:hypothetical protein
MRACIPAGPWGDLVIGATSDPACQAVTGDHGPLFIHLLRLEHDHAC